MNKSLQGLPACFVQQPLLSVDPLKESTKYPEMAQDPLGEELYPVCSVEVDELREAHLLADGFV